MRSKKTEQKLKDVKLAKLQRNLLAGHKRSQVPISQFNFPSRIQRVCEHFKINFLHELLNFDQFNSPRFSIAEIAHGIGLVTMEKTQLELEKHGFSFLAHDLEWIRKNRLAVDRRTSNKVLNKK